MDKVNKWKIAFAVLLGLLFGIAGFLWFRMADIREPGKDEIIAEITETEATFQIELNKAQANRIVNYYLQEFQKDSPIKYQFILEKQALLIGMFQIFGYDIEFYLYFEPQVLDNGDVQLKAKSVSIGTLKLPIKELLKYVKNNFKLPDWTEINVEEETMILHLSQYKVSKIMYLHAREIDLIDDNICFDVSLPNIKEE